MKRVILVLGLAAVLSIPAFVSSAQRSSGEAPGPQPDYSVPFWTVDWGFDSRYRYGDWYFHGEDRVIRDSVSWEAFWREHTNGTTPPVPPPSNISWGEEMVLATFMGFYPNCCVARIEITHVERNGDILTAYVQTTWEDGMLMMITNPFHFIAVQSAPTVVFWGGHGNDVNPPTGSIVINNGDQITWSRDVTLTLTYSDYGSGVSKVRFSSDGVWDDEPWEQPSPRKAYVLSPGNGIKTVFYQIIDNAGLLSPTYTDDIELRDARTCRRVEGRLGLVRCAGLTWRVEGAPEDSTRRMFPGLAYGEFKPMAV